MTSATDGTTRLLIAGAWSPASDAEVAAGHFDVLELHGGTYPDFEFLVEHAPQIEQVSVLGAKIESAAGLEKLHRLRSLTFSAPIKGLRFSLLPALTTLNINVWQASFATELARCETLKALRIEGFSAADCTLFGAIPHLERLTLARGALCSLSGLRNCHHFEAIHLSHLRKFHDIGELVALTSPRALGIGGHGSRAGVIHNGHLVVCGRTALSGAPRVMIIDAHTDRLHGFDIPRDSEPSAAIAASSEPVAWMPLGGGFALRIDMKQRKVDKVKVRTGLTGTEWMRLATSPDGGTLLVGIAFDPKRPLLLTNLRDLHERFVLAEEESVRVPGQPGEYPLLRRQPGFAFVGDAPEVLSRGERHRLNALQRHADLAPSVVRVASKRLPPALQQRISASDLVSRMADLDAVYSPGVVVGAHRLPKGPPRRGESRLGGLPDLGQDAAWPLFNGAPMAFLAQFDLAQIHAAAPGNRLPKAGLLSFFRALDDETGGPRWYDPESEAGAAMVLFAPDVEDLAPARLPAHPVSSRRSFASPPCAIDLLRACAIPPIDSLRMSQWEMGDDEREAYLSLASSLASDEGQGRPRHQLLGYHDHDGTWHEVSAERMANGLDQFGDMDRHSDASRQLIRKASAWIPLVQFASCEVADWMWGDGGALRWLIREDDLDLARFDRAIAVSVR